MNIKKEFENYWKTAQYTADIRNPNEFYENFTSAIAGFTETYEIDEYVKSQTKKEKVRRIVVNFYEYLRRKYNNTIDSDLYDRRFYDETIERQLEIVKYLQNNPKKMEEIAQVFGVRRQTIGDDLKALEEGIEVLGSTISIEKERQGTSYLYSTTVHPVFLPLNLTEVYAMTVYLDNTINQNDPNAQIIRNISARIKSQLSDYAKAKLFPEENLQGISNDYVNDRALAEQREGILMYLIKSGQKCRFIWRGEEHTGSISYRSGQYTIRTKDKEYPDVDPEELEFIIESLEYK